MPSCWSGSSSVCSTCCAWGGAGSRSNPQAKWGIVIRRETSLANGFPLASLSCRSRRSWWGASYLPLAFITTAMASGFMLTKRVPRWARSVLILVYAVLVVGEWFMEVHQGAFAKMSFTSPRSEAGLTAHSTARLEDPPYLP